MGRGLKKNEKLEIKQDNHVGNNGNCHYLHQPTLCYGKHNNEQHNETVRTQSNGNKSFGTDKSY